MANQSIQLPDVGRRVKAARALAGMTQAQLAEHTGYSPQFICAIELGKVSARIDHLNAIAAALRVATTSLLEPAEAEPLPAA